MTSPNTPQEVDSGTFEKPKRGSKATKKHVAKRSESIIVKSCSRAYKVKVRIV